MFMKESYVADSFFDGVLSKLVERLKLIIE